MVRASMLLLLGCVAPLPIDAPSEAVLAALDDDTALDVFAVVVDESPVSLSDGGPPFAMGELGFSAWGRHPVVETGDDVRLVVSHAGVRLLPWVGRDGLMDMMARSTWVGADGHAVEGDAPGIRVPGAVPIEVREDGSFAEIRTWLTHGEVRVADGLVDQAARADDEDTLARLTIEGDRMLESGATLRDDAGNALLTIDPVPEPDTGVVSVRVLTTEPDRVLVELDLGAMSTCEGGGSWYARGWVRPDELDPTSFAGGGSFSCCCGGGFGFGGFGSLWTLAPGTLLYDAPEGALVGITEDTVAVDLSEGGGDMPGWTSVLVPSPWGYGEVWVDAALVGGEEEDG